MATVGQWIEGARPRTLPNAIAPVLAGSGAAAHLNAFSPLRAGLALGVALTLIIGVNYANDYSDGIRGTDGESRVGPLRLVGSGVARPQSVLGAALTFLIIAGLLGLLLVLISQIWWLLGVGAVCLAGAWFYTGGRKPYGYAGFGELAVFLFFGPVAVLGTTYVQAYTVDWLAIGCAVAMGTFSAAVLLANNLRDIPTDRRAGKTTLAVRLGDRGTRALYFVLIAAPFVITVAMGLLLFPPVFFGVVAAALVASAARTVADRVGGTALIGVLRDTGLAMLGWSALTAAALAFG